MTKPLTEIDHVTNAAGNFLSQYEQASLFKGFTNSFLKELNQLEEQFKLFTTITSINTAQGVNLTNMGRILAAQSRPVDDELFRVLLYSLAAAYTSEGTPEDIRSVVILSVNASSVFIQDFGGGNFSIIIFKPDFKFGQSLIYDIVNIAKPIGVTFQNFSIADTFSDPTFSFLGDTRANSEGFAVAVPISVPATYYTAYVFPPTGTIAVADRIVFESSNGNPEENYELVIYTSDADTGFNAQLLVSYAVVGGQLSFNNKTDGIQMRLTVLDAVDCYRMVVGSNYQEHRFTVRRNYIPIALLREDSRASVPTLVEETFNPYLEGDEAAFTALNPSGLGRTLVPDPTDFPNVYGTSGGGRYSIAIN